MLSAANWWRILHGHCPSEYSIAHLAVVLLSSVKAVQTNLPCCIRSVYTKCLSLRHQQPNLQIETPNWLYFSHAPNCLLRSLLNPAKRMSGLRSSNCHLIFVARLKTVLNSISKCVTSNSLSKETYTYTDDECDKSSNDTVKKCAT